MAKARKKAAAKRTPVLVRDENYEVPAVEFLHILAMGIDLSLKEANITDTKLRRKIVDNFCWETAEFLDTQWFQTPDGKRHFPVVCFGDRHVDDRPTSLRMPRPGHFSFHEFAADLFNEVTRKGKGPYDVIIGDLGDEEPIDLERE